MPEGGGIPTAVVGDLDATTILSIISIAATAFEFARQSLEFFRARGLLKGKFAQILEKRKNSIDKHAKKCREKTGYIGALAALNTVFITASVLFINLLFNILNNIRIYFSNSPVLPYGEIFVYILIFLLMVFSLLRMAFVFEVCSSVVTHFNQGDDK